MFVAVQSKLCEGMLRRGDDSGEECAPEVTPARGESLWVWDAVEEHGQLETSQGRKEGLESTRIEGGKVPNAQVVHGEGCQLRRHVDSEAGRESAEDRRLECETIGFHSAIVAWVERQVDGLEPGQLVNARKQTREFVDDLSSD